MRDVRDLRLVTRSLLERGLGRAVVEKVMGRNLRRFLADTSPGEPAPFAVDRR